MNENKQNLPKIGFIISIVNTVFCFISAVSILIYMISSAYSSTSASAQEAAGWFVIVAPMLAALYMMACIPDFISLILAYFYKKANKTIYLVVTIILSLLGILIMNTKLMYEVLYDSLNITIYIYTALKIVIILYSAFLLIKVKNQ